jgi:cell wall-associated NlpC family hydrolase
MTIEFINSLIGKSYEIGASGPESYDCWGLVKVVQKELFDRNLPDISQSPSSLKNLIVFVREHSARKEWRVSENKFQHGQLVEMSKNENPFHIGVYLDYDGGGILHALGKIGVCFDKPQFMQLMGWRKMVFHDWID